MDREEDLVNINLSLRLSAARGCLFRSNLDNEESNQMSKLNYYNSNPYYQVCNLSDYTGSFISLTFD